MFTSIPEESHVQNVFDDLAKIGLEYFKELNNLEYSYDFLEENNALFLLIILINIKKVNPFVYSL